MGTFDTQKAQFGCPSCGKPVSEKLGRLKENPTLNCPHCHKPFTVDAKGLRDRLKSVDKAVADLTRTVKNLGKR